MGWKQWHCSSSLAQDFESEVLTISNCGYLTALSFLQTPCRLKIQLTLTKLSTQCSSLARMTCKTPTSLLWMLKIASWSSCQSQLVEVTSPSPGTLWHKNILLWQTQDNWTLTNGYQAHFNHLHKPLHTFHTNASIQKKKVRRTCFSCSKLSCCFSCSLCKIFQQRH